jgi:hypothetical protein
VAVTKRSRRHTRGHTLLAAVWAAMIPISIATGWLYSIAFVSACSIYANTAAHWAAREGADDEDG